MLREGLTLEEAESRFARVYLLQAAAVEDAHMGRTALMLGLHRNTLLRRLQAVGLHPDMPLEEVDDACA